MPFRMDGCCGRHLSADRKTNGWMEGWKEGWWIPGGGGVREGSLQCGTARSAPCDGPLRHRWTGDPEDICPDTAAVLIPQLMGQKRSAVRVSKEKEFRFSERGAWEEGPTFFRGRGEGEEKKKLFSLWVGREWIAEIIIIVRLDSEDSSPVLSAALVSRSESRSFVVRRSSFVSLELVQADCLCPSTTPREPASLDPPVFFFFFFFNSSIHPSHRHRCPSLLSSRSSVRLPRVSRSIPSPVLKASQPTVSSSSPPSPSFPDHPFLLRFPFSPMTSSDKLS